MLPALFRCYLSTCVQFCARVCLVHKIESQVNMKSLSPVMVLKSPSLATTACAVLSWTHMLYPTAINESSNHTPGFLHGSVSSGVSHKWGPAVYNLLTAYFSLSRTREQSSLCPFTVVALDIPNCG